MLKCAKCGTAAFDPKVSTPLSQQFFCALDSLSSSKRFSLYFNSQLEIKTVNNHRYPSNIAPLSERG